MHIVIDQITEYLVGLVKTRKEFYTPEDLLVSGIPAFLVKQIRAELEREMLSEIHFPHVKWLNRTNPEVLGAWGAFTEAASKQVSIPEKELFSVIFEALKIIMLVLAEPRKKLADYLFGIELELSYAELEQRCNRITFQNHFTGAIPKYMQKKKLESLTKERCKVFINTFDEKIIQSYQPQDWLNRLHSLFALYGGRIDPRLLVLYFEDKQLDKFVFAFEKVSHPVGKDEFLDIISALYKDEDIHPDVEPELKNDDQLNEETFFNEIFIPATKEEEEENLIDEETGEKSLSDIFAVKDTNGGGDEYDEKPMWAQFVDTDEGEKESGLNDVFVENPTNIEITTEPVEKPKPVESKLRRIDRPFNISLRDLLATRSEAFIMEVYAGSRKKYLKSVEELEKLNNWEEASVYIEKKVFSKNNVDLLSETTVEFTDILQTYFTEHKQ